MERAVYDHTKYVPSLKEFRSKSVERSTLIKTVWLLRPHTTPSSTLKFLRDNGVAYTYEDGGHLEVEATASALKSLLLVDFHRYVSNTMYNDELIGLEYNVSLSQGSVPKNVYNEVEHILGINGHPMFLDGCGSVTCGTNVVVFSKPFAVEGVTTHYTIFEDLHLHPLDEGVHNVTDVYFTQNSEIGLYEVLKCMNYNEVEGEMVCSGLSKYHSDIFDRLVGNIHTLEWSNLEKVVEKIPTPIFQFNRPIQHTSIRRILPPVVLPKKVNRKDASFLTIPKVPQIEVSFKRKAVRRSLSGVLFSPIIESSTPLFKARDGKIVPEVNVDVTLKSVAFTDNMLRYSIKREWEFGDGSVSTDNTPTHTYKEYGTYTVRVRIHTIDGTVTDTVVIKKDIEISHPTLMSSFFSKNPTGKVPHKVNFEDTSSGDISSRLWNFGDGETSRDSNPTHLYSKSGMYDVSLTVNDVTGNEHTSTRRGYVRVGRV